jgi:hypothetical protein
MQDVRQHLLKQVPIQHFLNLLFLVYIVFSLNSTAKRKPEKILLMLLISYVVLPVCFMLNMEIWRLGLQKHY